MPKISEPEDVMSQILRKWEEVVEQEKAKQPLMFSVPNQSDKFQFTSAHHEALVMCQMIKLTRIGNLFGIHAIKAGIGFRRQGVLWKKFGQDLLLPQNQAELWKTMVALVRILEETVQFLIGNLSSAS